METAAVKVGVNVASLFAYFPEPYPYKPPKNSVCSPLFPKGRIFRLNLIIICFDAGNYKTSSNGAPNHGLIQHSRSILLIHDPIQKARGAVNAPLKAGLKSSNQNSEPLPRCILLDIEGTTTPITFVTDVLFPYARDNVAKHLSATYETENTQDDIKLLRSQVEDDLAQGVNGAIPIPPDDAGKDAVIAALVANVEAMIKADRKITALKQLQGHVWRTGFQNNELEGVVYDDVPEALKSWHALGIKVYIYSSGSRLAQRLIFGNTNAGDLRRFLSGFFDTNVGTKRESSSYIQISESLGVDSPSEILFLTDVVQEAVAAKAAGLKVLISVRPGNSPLPENHGFKTINSFLEV